MGFEYLKVRIPQNQWIPKKIDVKLKISKKIDIFEIYTFLPQTTTNIHSIWYLRLKTNVTYAYTSKNSVAAIQL